MADEEPEGDPNEICETFLKDSPPGQFGAVLTDLKLLNPALDDGLVEKTLMEFNKLNLRVVDAEGSRVVCCPAGALDATHYVDAKAGAVVAVNHKEMTASKAEGAPPGASPEATAFREALQSELEGYVKRQFPDAVVAVYAKDAGVSVVITAEKLNLKNYWSGQWNSTWTVAVRADGVTLEGVVKCRAHYFEDGNVQLVTEKAFEPVELPAAAAKVSEAIAAKEGAIQQGLEGMYSGMSEDTFKAMRRTMPITRTKMNWNLSDVKLKQNLTAGKR